MLKALDDREDPAVTITKMQFHAIVNELKPIRANVSRRIVEYRLTFPDMPLQVKLFVDMLNMKPFEMYNEIWRDFTRAKDGTPKQE